MKALKTLLKAILLLAGIALAAFGALCLYKKLFKKTEEKEFEDGLDYDSDFGYDEIAFEEDKIAQKIKSAKDKIASVIA